MKQETQTHDDRDPVSVVDPEIWRAWANEVQRRWELHESGEIESINGEQLFRRIRTRYESRGRL